MLFYEAFIDESKPEGHKYSHKEIQIKPNEWITAKPWAIEQSVFIQDFDDKVEFGWVDCVITKQNDGKYKITGLSGGNGNKPIKCWMKIAFPYDDYTGWYFDGDEEAASKLKKGNIYVVCVESKVGQRARYDIYTARYNPTKTSDWDGYDFKETTRNVIAWRDFPKPSRKRKFD